MYSSSVYFCHLFLISFASVRFLLFLPFIVPIFAWKVPLVSLTFLKRSLVFPILLLSSISLHCSLKKAFLFLLAILWNSEFRWVHLSFSPLPFASLLFSVICKPPQPFYLLAFLLTWGWFWSLLWVMTSLEGESESRRWIWGQESQKANGGGVSAATAVLICDQSHRVSPKQSSWQPRDGVPVWPPGLSSLQQHLSSVRGKVGWVPGQGTWESPGNRGSPTSHLAWLRSRGTTVFLKTGGLSQMSLDYTAPRDSHFILVRGKLSQ